MNNVDYRLRKNWKKSTRKDPVFVFHKSPTLSEIEERLLRPVYIDPLVYVLQSGKFFKIGCTSYLSNRLNELQTGNPEKLRVIFKIRTKKHFEIEQMLHQKFSSKRTVGEWFLLSKFDLFELKNLIDALKTSHS